MTVGGAGCPALRWTPLTQALYPPVFALRASPGTQGGEGSKFERSRQQAEAKVKPESVRFVICLIGIAAAAIIFLVTDFSWLPAALSIAVAVLSFAIAELVFRRLADPETVRRDLEERSREGML